MNTSIEARQKSLRNEVCNNGAIGRIDGHAKGAEKILLVDALCRTQREKGVLLHRIRCRARRVLRRAHRRSRR